VTIPLPPGILTPTTAGTVPASPAPP
jgi:hypothetical protein